MGIGAPSVTRRSIRVGKIPAGGSVRLPRAWAASRGDFIGSRLTDVSNLASLPESGTQHHGGVPGGVPRVLGT